MLEEARRRGFLGPGPVQAHVDHAAGFVTAVESTGAATARRAADLGSGGGVPALPLAVRFSRSQWILVESAARRAAFLREAVEALELGPRVAVVEARAEVAARDPAWRAGIDLVTARGFGPPAVVAECGAPLLRVGGWAVISEPPGGDPGRWPREGLALVGMAPEAAVTAAGASYQVLRQIAPCPPRFPRRVGMPAKPPLF